MAKNKKTKSAKKDKKKPHPNLSFFSSVLRLSEKAISNDGSDSDEYFKRQADKFRKLIEEIS